MRLPFISAQKAPDRFQPKNSQSLFNAKKRSLLAASFYLAIAQTASAGVFINEIHYDNSGGDVGEAIEIAGDAGTDLTGWTIVLYNGNNSSTYRTENLTGVLPNQQDGFGTLIFPVNGIQNGAPDGMALIDASAQVIEFISYEGTIVAANGPAVGLTSTDIGVSEPGSTTVGDSLQLSGTGNQASDFTWQAASANTYGSINTNQTFGGGGPQVDLPPSVIATSPADNTGAIALSSNIDINFSEGVNLTGNWFAINCGTSGVHTAVLTGGPQQYVLNPDVDFANNEICNVNIVASLVSDIDANDPPDSMDSDVSFSFSTEVGSPIRINEVDADTAGSDTLEFIELYDGGAGNTPLDGLVVVLYNGSNLGSYNAFDLDGFKTDDKGFFVLGNAAVLPAPAMILNNNSLQNGADAVAVFAGDAADFPNGTAVSGFALVDAVVYDTSDADIQGLLQILTPNQPQVNENDAGNKDLHSNSRVPDGGDALITSSYNAQLASPGASNVTEAEIFEIQGAGLTSPFVDGYVRTLDNIVTALDTNGFFMQTPEARSDADSNTSDGIFVFTGAAPSVIVGDAVNVEGRVIEFFGFTEFTGGTRVTKLSSGNTLPAIVVFDETMPSPIQPQPENEMERFEGMIVSFEGIASAATDRFGDTQVVAGSQRPFRGPGIEFPGLTGLPVWDGNPEIFEIDPDALGAANESLFAGQTVSATGPLGFSFGDYQIWPTSITIGSQPDLIAKVRPREASEITVGTLNMFRLFDNILDPSIDDTAVPEAEYLTRLNKISRFIIEVMDAPDILATVEVENLGVLEALAAQITTNDPSVQYTAYLQEGNDIGGIDVGFLVRQNIVMDEITQFGKDTIFDFDGRLLNDRPPLLFKGRATADGSDFPIQVLAVHNRSLSGINRGSRGSRVRAKRLAQAQFVAQLVQDIQTAEPKVNLVITGDFNAYQFSDGYVDVLGQITGTSVEGDNLLWEASPVDPVLTNHVNGLPAEEQYSFVFGGSAQVLDHAVTSSNLEKMVTGFTFARGNSDVPANLVLDDTTPMRSSDHDGVVLFIKKDSDNDTVFDNLDMCATTKIPETAPQHGLKRNHFALTDGDNLFDTPYSRHSFNLDETAGCSCEQIINQLGIGRGHSERGCSVGIMERWVKLVKHRRAENHGKRASHLKRGRRR